MVEILSRDTHAQLGKGGEVLNILGYGRALDRGD